MTRVLAIDLSTKTGWAVFTDGTLTSSGSLPHETAEDFNVNADPNLSPKYPWNIVEASIRMADRAMDLVCEWKPDCVAVENTVKGRNRHTQRLLEFFHFSLLYNLRFRYRTMGITPTYMDPSEWRKIVEMRLSKDQKKNNRDVSAGKKRGRIGKKHLSVAMVNEKFGKTLKLKDNDEADAILLGLAYVTRKNQEILPQ